MGRGTAGRLFTALAIIVVLALLLGQLFGQPLLLSYVETGSMEPELAAGDGFVAVPPQLAGPIETGDVITYDSRTEDGLTTHRVVAQREQGYVTRGDANPFTDQDGGEPPVTDGQVVAVALEVDGSVLTIPHLGTLVMGLQAGVERGAAGLGIGDEGRLIGPILVGIGLVLLIGGLVRGGHRRTRTRSRSRNRQGVVSRGTVIAVVAAVLIVAATAAMVLPAGTTEYEVAASDSPTDDPLVVEPGAEATVDRSIATTSVVPVVAIQEPASPGTAVSPERLTLGPRDETTSVVTLTAPDEEGTVVKHVEEYRYVALLPPGVIGWLHDVHPLLALAGTNAVILLGVSGVVLALFGPGPIRLRLTGGILGQRVTRDWQW